VSERHPRPWRYHEAPGRKGTFAVRDLQGVLVGCGLDEETAKEMASDPNPNVFPISPEAACTLVSNQDEIHREPGWAELVDGQGYVH
jgi:hypothetical protein